MFETALDIAERKFCLPNDAVEKYCKNTPRKYFEEHYLNESLNKNEPD